jgi:hypothetical protein
VSSAAVMNEGLTVIRYTSLKFNVACIIQILQNLHKKKCGVYMTYDEDLVKV